MNEISRNKAARTVAELASACQHQEKLAGHHGARGGGYGFTAHETERFFTAHETGGNRRPNETFYGGSCGFRSVSLI